MLIESTRWLELPVKLTKDNTPNGPNPQTLNLCPHALSNARNNDIKQKKDDTLLIGLQIF